MNDASSISSRKQCLRIANADALAWAEDSAIDTFNDLTRETYPTSQEFTKELAKYDVSFASLSESPAFVAGVPDRWRRLYDATLERVYRRAIRRIIAREESAN